MGADEAVDVGDINCLFFVFKNILILINNFAKGFRRRIIFRVNNNTVFELLF